MNITHDSIETGPPPTVKDICLTLAMGAAFTLAAAGLAKLAEQFSEARLPSTTKPEPPEAA